MQKITIDDKLYDIPTSWGEMNFGTFLKLSDYIKSLSEIEEGDYPDNLFYSNVLTILTDTPKHSFVRLSVLDSILFRKSISFISDKFENDPYSKTIEFENMVFKIRNFEEFKFGEYTDIQHLSSTPKDKNLITLLSIMTDVYLKKDIKKFRFKEKKIELGREEKEALIKQLPATKANAVLAFFLHGQKQSLRNIASYFNRTARRTSTKVFFQAVGLIIYGLWMRVVKILRSLILLLTFRFDKSLRIWRTKLPRII